jgi:hypothetical protein
MVTKRAQAHAASGVADGSEMQIRQIGPSVAQIEL